MSYWCPIGKQIGKHRVILNRHVANPVTSTKAKFKSWIARDLILVISKDWRRTPIKQTIVATSFIAGRFDTLMEVRGPILFIYHFLWSFLSWPRKFFLLFSWKLCTFSINVLDITKIQTSIWGNGVRKVKTITKHIQINKTIQWRFTLKSMKHLMKVSANVICKISCEALLSNFEISKLADPN